MIRDRGRAHRLAAVVIEPVVVVEPTREWLEMLRAETTRAGAGLIFDEIKTAVRIAIGGALLHLGLQAAPELGVGRESARHAVALTRVGERGRNHAGARDGCGCV